LAWPYSHVAFGSLPPRPRDEVRASIATAKNLRSTIDEFVLAGASVERAASLRDFSDKPLVVLTAGKGSDAKWFAAQNHLATLSTNSVHRIVGGADHEALIADEEGAGATTQAILDAVQAVRSHTPLR
jgi:monoamine oxidase